MKIGFIGLGNMGAAIAANLLKAKHESRGVESLGGQGAAAGGSRCRVGIEPERRCARTRSCVHHGG